MNDVLTKFLHTLKMISRVHSNWSPKLAATIFALGDGTSLTMRSWKCLNRMNDDLFGFVVSAIVLVCINAFVVVYVPKKTPCHYGEILSAHNEKTYCDCDRCTRKTTYATGCLQRTYLHTDRKFLWGKCTTWTKNREKLVNSYAAVLGTAESRVHFIVITKMNRQISKQRIPRNFLNCDSLKKAPRSIEHKVTGSESTFASWIGH